MPTPPTPCPSVDRRVGRLVLGSACGLVLATSLLGCELDRTSKSGAAPGQNAIFGNQLTGPPDLPDLANPSTDADMTPGHDCKAAAGLPGVRLLCIDFDTATAAELQKWSFAVGTTCGGRSWEVNTLAMPESKDRALQLQNFATYSGASCGFQAPALDLSQYPSVTLSIEHWVDLAINTSTKAMQLAEIWAVPNLMPPRVSLYQGQDLAWRRFTVRIRSQELTSAPTFQPHFNLSSPGMFGDTYAGWRIRSIAVLGE